MSKHRKTNTASSAFGAEAFKEETDENQEAKQDWGVVEQNAYERIQEGSDKNVSGEEFLSWLSELEQGNDV